MKKLLIWILCILLVVSSVNAVNIDFSLDTPVSGTSTTNLVLKTIINETTDDVYTFLNINDSLVDWWHFDNVTNRLQNSIDASNPMNEVSLVSYVNSIFDIGAYVNETNRIQSSKGFKPSYSFTLKYNSKQDWNSDLVNTDMISTKGSNTGWVFRQTINRSTNYTFFNMLFYDGSGYMGHASVDTTGYIKNGEEYALAVSIDMENNKAVWFHNGQHIKTQNLAINFDLYQLGGVLLFPANPAFNATYDEIMVINRSITISEGIAMTRLDSVYNNTFNFNTLEQDYTFSVNAIGYTSSGETLYSDTREYISLVAPIIVYNHSYSESELSEGDKAYFYCKAEYNSSTVSTTIERGIDESWATVPSSFLTSPISNESYAILGDSMSNNYAGDWPVKLAVQLGLNETHFNLASWDGSGKSCQYVLDTQVLRIDDGTENVFLTCGVNNMINTDHEDIWEQIYDELKSKGVENVYMTTMPPWDYINGLADETATEYCNKQKDANEWLKSFAILHDDLYVADTWTIFHDTTGTNKTDCGWNPSAGYSSEGVHPNPTGYQVWADEYWDLLNQKLYGTYNAVFTAPSLSEDTEVSFRCYSDYDSRMSLYFDMGTYNILQGTILNPNAEMEDGINGVKIAVFAGFGLIAVALLASIAFLITKMFNNGADMASLTTISIMAIGLAIVLFVGYIIISAVAEGLI